MRLGLIYAMAIHVNLADSFFSILGKTAKLSPELLRYGMNREINQPTLQDALQIQIILPV